MRDYKASNARYYRAHSEPRKTTIRARQKQFRATISQLKLDIGCKICGYRKCSSALQFHHVDDNKEHGISMMTAQGRSMKAIMAEISKCICICANCHHEIHQADGWKHNPNSATFAGRPKPDQFSFDV